MRVCVFCASSTRIAPQHLELATAVGTALGRRGHELVSGGGSVGSMGAVAAAARAAGARTTGVIPTALRDAEVADEDADELVVTTDMRTRKGEMDRRADAFLVLPGGIGTLEELLEVWTARSLGLHGKPVVVLDPSGVYAGLRRLVEDLADARFVRAGALADVVWTSTVDEALDACEALPAPSGPPTDEELLEAEP